ncbi:hypothetical protein KIL84_006414 [Mauremys mutica]|uniref:Uncharacterized protein n=1 Tax=Mauremys mutica TaxID=74926 RepID=A0A9D3WZT1_9SAUR|nr:hypothetical protein KIL84_006414 [Mauremys mutica]
MGSQSRESAIEDSAAAFCTDWSFLSTEGFMPRFRFSQLFIQELISSKHWAIMVVMMWSYVVKVGRLCPILANEDLASVIHAFVTSWLDYSNA